MSIKQFSGGQYSQNGEAGIIDECINRIKPKLAVAVEFGAPTREYCSNIFHLIKQGWDCKYFDINPVDPLVTRMEITAENVNTLPECSILSMDTDGMDWTLWKAYKGKPDIVIIEINSSLNPDIDFYTKDKGANFSIMNKLAKEKGYFLLCHTGNNIYCLNKHKKLFPDVDETFNTSWL